VLFRSKSNDINFGFLTNKTDFFEKIDLSPVGVKKEILDIFEQSEKEFVEVFKNKAQKEKESLLKAINILFDDPGDWDE